MKSLDRYKKTSRKNRKTKVSSINLEFYQHRMLKEKSLNLSLLVRDLLDDYFSKNFSDRYKFLKSVEIGLENNEVEK